MKATRRTTRRTTRHEVLGLLELAGGRESIGPDRGFRVDLEHRLLTTNPPGRLVALPTARRRARRPGVISGAAAAAAAVVLAGALTGAYGRGVDDQTLALAVAVDTVVQLPDGTMVTGEQGLSLPDGAVVRTGPNGHCAAGDIEQADDRIFPQAVAVAGEGHLVDVRGAADDDGHVDRALGRILAGSGFDDSEADVGGELGAGGFGGGDGALGGAA